MRAAFLTADVLTPSSDSPAILQRLSDAGIEPTVLVPRLPDGGETRTATGFRQVVLADEDGYGWGEHAEPLLRVAQAAQVNPGEAFVVSQSQEQVAAALAAGFRPVLVLGDRSLDQILGPHEPDDKGFAVAPDLVTAAAYILDEAAHDRALGPFPFGTHRPLDERAPAILPTTGDLAKIFVVVIAAGVAAALGIAYLLQEIYQTYRFPRVAYWITLQFIPQTWRGLLFLLIGAIGVLVAQRILNRIPARRRSP